MKQELLNWIQKRKSESMNIKGSDLLMMLQMDITMGVYDISNHPLCEELDIERIKDYVNDRITQNTKLPFDLDFIKFCTAVVGGLDALNHTITWGTCDSCGQVDRDISIHFRDLSLHNECFYGCKDLRSIPQGENDESIDAALTKII